MIITPRERDLGGFFVRRILPYATHRMVGPFIFFDHIGPATFAPEHGLSVRPHPHIHLATVTYLFEGAIQHRDSLGSNQLIEPGAINWMIAGRGIVHSERSPETLFSQGSRLSGLQCWIALPDQYENIEPSFTHYPAASLPSFEQGDACCVLLLGHLLGHVSPVTVHSDLFYCKADFSSAGQLIVPVQEREAAVYVVSGKVRVNGLEVSAFSMWVKDVAVAELEIEALEPSSIMLLGGASVGQRFIYWNFVSSTKEAIEQAKRDWASGPGSDRFSPIPGDDQEYIPLPEDAHTQPPQGNIL